MLKGSNWFARPESVPASGLERAWTSDKALLVDEHRRLRAAVAELTDADLGKVRLGTGKPAGFLIRGIAAHDLYHAGQIQLLKRLRAR